jgi:hypothetical protein
VPVVAVLVAVALGVVVGIAVAATMGEQTPDATSAGVGTSEPAPPQDARTGAGRALTVLRRWDARRASAYRLGDVDRLTRLYVPGSGAGLADARTLLAYLDRGLVVREMHRQVYRARVLSLSGSLLRVRVADRLVGAVVSPQRRPEANRPLPSGELARRTVTLVRGSAGWQVRSVTAARPRPGW